MQIYDIISALEKGSKFLEWKKKHDGFYLVNVFRMMDETDTWHLGYYNAEQDKIITFQVEKEKTEITPASDVFKKPEDTIAKLNVTQDMIDWKEALDKAKTFQKEKYPKEIVFKSFFIMQDLGDGVIYNITFVTKSFNTLNIRMSAESGKVIKDSLHSLMELGEFQKGISDGAKDTKTG